MGLGVHENDGVRRHFRIVRFDKVFDGLVEVFGGRLLHHDRLGRRIRVRLGNLERVEESGHRRSLELEV